VTEITTARAAQRPASPLGAPGIAGTVALLLVAGTAVAASPPDFARLVQQQGASVVNISTGQRRGATNRAPDAAAPADPFRRDDPERSLGEGQSLGSGLILSPDGYVLTCAHVVEDAREIHVRLTDRREYSARLVGADRRGDIALLKVQASNLPKVVIGDPNRLQVGEWVLAIGSPFGFENSATAGIISAKSRALPGENYVSFIQSDVPINLGNSGGPLFNLKGEVIGINSQILSRTSGGFLGLSFAIPIDIAVRIAEQLKDYGYVRRGWLGISLQDVSRDMAAAYGLPKPRGALVADLLPGGPGARSELRRGDIILEYEGQSIDLSSELSPHLGLTRPGTQARMTVFRRNQGMQTISVAVGELAEPTVARKPAAEPRTGTNRLGLVLAELGNTQRRRPELEPGVAVEAVEEGAARDAGLRSGDIIVEVDGKSVGSIAEFHRRVELAPRGKATVLRVRRGAGSVFLALRLGE
jgi:serine protease Do